MFNLEIHLEQWRKQLQSSLPPQTLNELENHLRDDYERRIQEGASPEEAFQRACTQLGDPDRLSVEFAKLQAQPWWAARCAFLLTLILMGTLITSTICGGLAGQLPLLWVHVLAVLGGYVTMFIMGSLGAIYLLARPFGLEPITHRESIRTTILRLAMCATISTGVATVLGMQWAHENLGRYWAWDPKERAAFLIFLWSCWLVWLAGRSRSSVLALMCAALAGNVVTALGWFGTNEFPKIGSMSFSLFLWGFVGLHAVILLCGLLPPQRRTAR